MRHHRFESEVHPLLNQPSLQKVHHGSRKAGIYRDSGEIQPAIDLGKALRLRLYSLAP
jgi:hypothetical protein